MARPRKGRATERYEPQEHDLPSGAPGATPTDGGRARRTARATEVVVDVNLEAPASPGIPVRRRPARHTVRATQKYEPKDHPLPAPPPTKPRGLAKSPPRESGLDALRSPPRAPTLARPQGVQSAPQSAAPAAKSAAKGAAESRPKSVAKDPVVPAPNTSTGPSTKDAHLPAVGDTIEDRYRIVRPIGVGGMGHVFLVDHLRLHKQLALKLLSPEVLALDDRDSQKTRFLREAQAASRLQHAGIVDVLDVGSTAAGLPFIVMEYLSGEDLAERLASVGAVSWPHAKDLIVQVLEALEAAHAHGVVHRDIKPENCFLSRSKTGAETVKLVDFGIAKVLTEVGGAGPLTQRGELLGTPQYMSPEQALGRPVDNRSDVYAVGILLYELLCGVPPFDDGTPMEVLTNQITTPPPPLPDRVRSEVPDGAADVIAKALAKEPDDRYESARAMIEALEHLDAARLPAELAVDPEPSTAGPSASFETQAYAEPAARGGALPRLVAIAVGVALAAGLVAWALAGGFG